MAQNGNGREVSVPSHVIRRLAIGKKSFLFPEEENGRAIRVGREPATKRCNRKSPLLSKVNQNTKYCPGSRLIHNYEGGNSFLYSAGRIHLSFQHNVNQLAFQERIMNASQRDIRIRIGDHRAFQTPRHKPSFNFQNACK